MMCAGLRYNWRVCAMTGGLAVAQYATLVALADARFDLRDPRYAVFPDGAGWYVQAVRLVLLSAAAVTSTAIVLRTQALWRLSATDRLTGILNRGAFDERLAEEAMRARRYRRSLTVALLDLDHFKQVNDRFGHARGDATLRLVTEVLRRSVRRTDIVARYGGEEFAVLFPETRPQDALPKLETIRAALAAGPLSEPDRPGPSVTTSIGVASWPEDGDEIHQVVGAADARLYAAKQAGRDRVVGPESAALASPPSPVPRSAT
jgi:diguanylate cyclase (GGDEF)-like protein